MPRDSRFELLRIIAMFMILMLHVNFFALRFPLVSHLHADPWHTLTRISLEMVALTSVNLFVLISGWWGIKPTGRGFAKFLFQCIFVISLMYATGIALGKAEYDIKGLQECVYFTKAWFVMSYAGLYLLAPVLNNFVANTSQATLRRFLIGFYVFQTVFGCFSVQPAYMSYGYSVFSFIGLYLLARYVRLYGQALMKYGRAMWLVSLAVAIAAYAVPLWCDTQDYDYIPMAYSAPTTVVGALGLLLMCASSRPWHSRAVNYIAASCFTVYLCHVCNTWTQKEFKAAALDIYHTYSGLEYLGIITLFMTAVFAASICLDQLRKVAWIGVEKIQQSVLKSQD